MKFKTNKDNSSYMMVNVMGDFPALLFDNELEIPEAVREKIDEMYFHYMASKLNKQIEVAIPKESLVGEFLLNNYDNKKIINLDEYISYDDIVNAYNIAVYDDNCKMSNRLFFLFKERNSGFVSELKEQKDEKAINYILEHRDFDMYLKKRYNEYEPSEYLVYENRGFSSKILLEKEKVKVKKLGD